MGVLDSTEPDLSVFREGDKYCRRNQSTACCFIPTIRWELQMNAFHLINWDQPDIRALMSRTIPAQVELMPQKIPFLLPQSTLDPSSVSSHKAWYIFHIMHDTEWTVTSLSVLLFCIFHHAHIMEKHACQSMLSKSALIFGVVAAMGAFTAGNCNVSTARQ